MTETPGAASRKKIVSTSVWLVVCEQLDRPKSWNETFTFTESVASFSKCSDQTCVGNGRAHRVGSLHRAKLCYTNHVSVVLTKKKKKNCTLKF